MLSIFGLGTRMTQPSPCLKTGKNLLFPFTNEGSRPTGQSQTVSTGVEEI